MVEHKKTEEEETGKSGVATLIIVLLLVFVWFILGVVAFVWSLLCFGKSGTSVDHIVGLLLALFFGPFYFIYYGVKKNYCRNV
jgi:hypothetical protein